MMDAFIACDTPDGERFSGCILALCVDMITRMMVNGDNPGTQVGLCISKFWEHAVPLFVCIRVCVSLQSGMISIFPWCLA